MLTNITTVLPEGAIEIVSLAKAKQQLRLEDDYNDEDDAIQGYIAAAVDAAQTYLNGPLCAQTLQLEFNRFDKEFVFEAFPVQSVASVKYFGSDGTQVTLAAEEYRLVSTNPKVWKLRIKNDLPATADRDDAVTIEIVVGYPTDAEGSGEDQVNTVTVPAVITQAILLMVTDMYARREDRSAINYTAAHALMAAYRKPC